MIISRTPLRISFVGGGTDFRSHYKHNKYGAVLSTSIDSYLYVTVKSQTSLFDEKYRLNYSITELVDDIESIENSIIKECLKFLDLDERLYISTIADAPESTGLGSSSSFCVGLLNALYKFKGETVSSGRLAEEAAHIECDILKRPMGKQDHYAAAFGGLNYIRFYDDETVTVRPLNMAADKQRQFSNSILMFWTGVTRPSESILDEQDKRNSENAQILTKMSDQANELSDLLMNYKISIEKIGYLLDKAWEMKKKLGSRISNSRIDQYYQTAMKNGACGGKLSGAGGGGFLTLIIEPSKHDDLIKAMLKIGLKQYSFGLDSEGTTVTQIN